MLTRVVLENFKSIEFCDVHLQPLTFLVGKNGSGKSNFLLALRFLQRAMRSELKDTVDPRTQIYEFARSGQGEVARFGIRVELRLSSESSASYSLRVSVSKDGPPRVEREECTVMTAARVTGHFERHRDDVLGFASETAPGIAADTLYLPRLAETEPFSAVHRFLSSMTSYHPVPSLIAEPYIAAYNDRALDRSGAVLANVLHAIQEHRPKAFERINEFLESIVDGLIRVEATDLAVYRALRFHFTQPSGQSTYYASSVSEGTLRALALLVALYQSHYGGPYVSLVSIEEPEAMLHPWAAAVMYDALSEAALTVQVIASSHSPELLDRSDIADDSILVFENSGIATKAGPLAHSSRAAVREQLCTPGELFRMNQMIGGDTPVLTPAMREEILFSTIASQ